MQPQIDKSQRRLYTLGIIGLGLIFTAVWAAALVFIPAGQILTVMNYAMYFVSLTIVGTPSFAVLQLYTSKRNAIIGAVVAWVVWVFGVRYLFILLLSAIAGR